MFGIGIIIWDSEIVVDRTKIHSILLHQLLILRQLPQQFSLIQFPLPPPRRRWRSDFTFYAGFHAVLARLVPVTANFALCTDHAGEFRGRLFARHVDRAKDFQSFT